MDPSLGVAPGCERVPPRKQLLPQLGILEQLAVERDPDVAAFVRDRLATAREVDDRETSGTEGDPRLDVDLLVVGPAMGDGAGHREESRPGKLSGPVQVDRAGDAAHKSPRLLGAAVTGPDIPR